MLETERLAGIEVVVDHSSNVVLCKNSRQTTKVLTSRYDLSTAEFYEAVRDFCGVDMFAALAALATLAKKRKKEQRLQKKRKTKL